MTKERSWPVYLITVVCFVILLISSSGTWWINETSTSDPTHQVREDVNNPVLLPPSERALSSILGNIEGCFYENQGQLDNPEVLFYAKGNPLSIGLLKDGVLFTLLEETMPSVGPWQEHDIVSREACSFTMTFRDSHPHRPLGIGRDSQGCNYYIGNDPEDWVTGVPVFKEVHYTSLYEGINLRFYFKNGLFKYDLIVEPDSDPSLILMEYEGVDRLSIDALTRKLTMVTPFGAIYDEAPLIVPRSGEPGLAIETTFKMIGPKQVTFEIPDWVDSREGFVIDPGLQFSTFLGGTSHDYGYDVDIDGEGNVYVVGRTASSDFPDTIGQYFLRDRYDLFITKFDPTLSLMLFSTYLGGNEGAAASERSYNIEVTPN
ncbi:MAG: SBBP repeat-containing protein, partial [Thermoplasmata archaeon]|nr:SBBP repeat-containing protein [Thermoplasmata archaeon]